MNGYDVNKDVCFSKDEKEYLVLPVDKTTTRWYYTREWDGCNAQQRILAYIDVDKSQIVKKSKYYMFVIWNIDNDIDKEYERRFNQGKVYRIKAKKWLGGDGFTCNTYPKDMEGLYVTDIIGTVGDCKELEEIYEQYMAPVVVQHKVLGEMKLDKDIYEFSGKVSYKGKDINVSTFVKEGNEKSWQKSIDMLAEYYQSFEDTDILAKELVSNKLYKLACEYNDNGITKDNIIDRIKVTGITLTNSQVEIDYDDDGIFGGHYVVAEGSVKSGLKKAYICG